MSADLADDEIDCLPAKRGVTASVRNVSGGQVWRSFNWLPRR